MPPNPTTGMPDLADMLGLIIGMKQLQNEVTRQRMMQDQTRDAKRASAVEAAAALPMGARASSLNASMYGGDMNEYNAALDAVRLMPENLVTQKTMSTARGYAAASPELLGNLDKEAASTNAAGMDTGGVGMAQFMATLAGNATPQITDEMGKGFANRNASGQTTLDATVDSRIMSDPAVLNFVTKLRAGQAISAPDQAQIDLGYSGQRLQESISKSQIALGQAELAEAMAQARESMGLTPTQQNEALNKAIGIVEQLTGRNMNKEGRNMSVGLLNFELQKLGIPPIQPDETMPSKLNGLRAWFQGLVGAGNETFSPRLSPLRADPHASGSAVIAGPPR